MTLKTDEQNASVEASPLTKNACMQVPLDSLDLSHVSILYTQGEMAAITPIYVRPILHHSIVIHATDCDLDLCKMQADVCRTTSFRSCTALSLCLRGGNSSSGSAHPVSQLQRLRS